VRHTARPRLDLHQANSANAPPNADQLALLPLSQTPERHVMRHAPFAQGLLFIAR
jgi:hypothetical protein